MFLSKCGYDEYTGWDKGQCANVAKSILQNRDKGCDLKKGDLKDACSKRAATLAFLCLLPLLAAAAAAGLFFNS